MIELREWKTDKFCSSHGTVDTSHFSRRTRKDKPKILLTCNSHAQEKLNWNKGSKHLDSHVTQCNKIEQANQEKNEQPSPSIRKKLGTFRAIKFAMPLDLPRSAKTESFRSIANVWTIKTAMDETSPPHLRVNRAVLIPVSGCRFIRLLSEKHREIVSLVHSKKKFQNRQRTRVKKEVTATAFIAHPRSRLNNRCKIIKHSTSLATATSVFL